MLLSHEHLNTLASMVNDWESQSVVSVDLPYVSLEACCETIKVFERQLVCMVLTVAQWER